MSESKEVESVSFEGHTLSIRETKDYRSDSFFWKRHGPIVEYVGRLVLDVEREEGTVVRVFEATEKGLESAVESVYEKAKANEPSFDGSYESALKQID